MWVDATGADGYGLEFSDPRPTRTRAAGMAGFVLTNYIKFYYLIFVVTVLSHLQKVVFAMSGRPLSLLGPPVFSM